jgi:hypothetical protein
MLTLTPELLHMDEYNSGMDPEIKRYFRKIMNSFSVGGFWLITVATAGIFFKLGFVADGIRWYNVLFYILLVVSIVFLIRYFYRVWNQKPVE